MIALSVIWRPEDQAWAQARKARRSALLGAGGWPIVAMGLMLAVMAPVADRLARWAVLNPHDTRPLLRAPEASDAMAAGVILGGAILLALLSRWLQGPGLRGVLEIRAAEGREPLTGPVAVLLEEGRATFRGAHWESSFDAALLTALEETSRYLLLRFGEARPVLLPRCDLTQAEAEAVRGWAAARLAGLAGRG